MEPAAIADYALIGDTRTAALCSTRGSIDWLCLPRFDSAPVFGRLLAGDEGGFFSLAVDGVRETARRYRDFSAVLETTWRTESSAVILTEGMVLDVSSALRPQAVLVRRVECRGDPVQLRIVFDPRLGLAGRPARAERRPGALVCTWGSLALGLQASPELHLVPAIEQRLALQPGSPVTFVLSLADRAPLVLVAPERAYELLEETDGWWRSWCEELRYAGPFRDPVARSLITLRLLTYSPSGAPVAAPTTSLPEVIGGARNWDYRFSWPRDASIGLGAFLAVGKEEEAHSYMHWLLHAGRLTRPRLEVLYTIFGKPGPPERELYEIPGYRGSRPVRIGNDASSQHQLDVYGWVVDAAWLLVRAGRRLHAETWRSVASFADFVAANWAQPDAGIWEVRGAPAHLVHSKLMAWLALDRALQIARSHRAATERRRRWEIARDAVAGEVRERGFDQRRGTYVRTYGGSELDAALLILPVLGFDDRGSPGVAGTVSAIRGTLGAGGPLVYRYTPGTDGLEGVEGAFLPCSFWLVQALAHLGRTDEAEELFRRLLAYSNDVGLWPEEIDPSTGAHLGNFPQAFTHATAVQAALALGIKQA